MNTGTKVTTHDKIVKCRSCGYVGPCDPTCCEHPDYDGATAEEAWQAAIEADRKRTTGSAKERFYAASGEQEQDPIERLRFYCSIAMSGQDWIDVEPFFDAVTADRQQRGEPVRQYYYQVSGCQAEKTTHPNCICWHDKGTGVFKDMAEGDRPHGVKLTWRDKPQPAEPVCTCKTHALGVVHRTDGPCFHYGPQPAEPVKMPSDEEVLKIAIDSGLASRDSTGDVVCAWREDADISEYLVENAHALLARYANQENANDQ